MLFLANELGTCKEAGPIRTAVKSGPFHSKLMTLTTPVARPAGSQEEAKVKQRSKMSQTFSPMSGVKKRRD